jgi:hypothetical protein
VESVHDFLELLHYSERPDLPVVFILDRESALDPRSQLGAPLEFKGMTWTRRWGYYPGRIQDNDPFLCANPQFLVVDSPDHMWFEHRIRPDPTYTVRNIGTYAADTVWLVRRRPTAPVASCPRRPNGPAPMSARPEARTHRGPPV